MSEKHDDLIGTASGKELQGEDKAKLPKELNEVHLVSLKANFELFLNRLLSTIWRFHFPQLSREIPKGKKVSLREFAESSVKIIESRADAQDFVVEQTAALGRRNG